MTDDTRVPLREYFEALRKEDQRALDLLGKEVGLRLDRLNDSFGELKSTVDSLHATLNGKAMHGQNMWTTLVQIITLIIAAAAIIVTMVYHTNPH